MPNKSGIEWTETTWSPVTGCTKVSAGCKNCYAEREVESRWSKNPKSVWYGRKFTDVQTHPDQLAAPIRWKAARRIFVCPRADLFHEAVPEQFIIDVFMVMAYASQHTFQVLTKRPERLRDVMQMITAKPMSSNVWGTALELARRFENADHAHDYIIQQIEAGFPNVWLGVSVEDQETANERIPLLLQTPIAVRFLSMEPLLGAVDLDRVWIAYDGETWLDWVIVGGESGPNARPMHPDWARSLRDQCVAAGVPFFFKQWGEWGPEIHMPVKDSYRWPIYQGEPEDGVWSYKVGKKAAGRLLDGQEWNEMPTAEALS